MRVYMLRRYHQRRNAAISFLGGKCRCGATKRLQFDHKDPNQKSFNLAWLWGVSEPRFWAEVAKCQLLCNACHEDKTRDDLGQENARLTHGTLAAHRYCKCSECRAVHAAYMREWRLHKKPS